MRFRLTGVFEYGQKILIIITHCQRKIKGKLLLQGLPQPALLKLLGFQFAPIFVLRA